MKLLSKPLLRQEWARQPRRWQLVLLACELLIAVFVSWLTPRLSEPVLQFLHRVFKLGTLTDIVLLNDYLSFYMLGFWLVFFELLAILVIPAEEGYLSLFFSKPLTRRQYLFTRLLPVLLLAFGIELALIFGSAGAILLLNGRADFSWGRYLAGSGISLSLGLLMVMLAQLLLLRLKDTYSAIVAAFAYWLLPVLPSSLMMYRPDLFEAHPDLRWWIVFPANLIWLEDGATYLAWGLVPLLLLLAAGALGLSAALLERHELP